MMKTDRPPILLVDDEPRIIDSLRDLLEDDFHVHATTNPLEALDILRDSRFAVILADQRMPQLTGDQFLARAQKLSDATRILVTGYTDIQALIRAVNDGQIFTYLPKPWEPAQLKVTVTKAAKHSEELTNRKAAAQRLAGQQEALAQSEAKLRDQKKLLQSILDSMGDGVIVMDKNGKVVLLNPAAETLVGRVGRDTPHSEWSQLHGIYRPGTDSFYPADELPLARAMRGEGVDGIELYMRSSLWENGAYMSVNVRPLMDDDGHAQGGVAVVRNITSAKESEDLLRRAKEEAERANRAKSEFLSRMSHELRTPLNSILGFAQLLQLARLGEESTDNVEHILKGGYHLLDLINEILDLARIESGKLNISTEPVPLGEVIQEAIDLVKPIAQDRNVRLTLDASIRPDSYVAADRQRLKQVILNLLANGIKFNHEGGIVSLSCHDSGGGRVRLEVRDTGRGIPEDGLLKVFTPFERLDADEAGICGTGLGLALSKRLIEAMGGTIRVESTVGTGSLFAVELPTCSPIEELELEPEDIPVKSEPAAHSLTGTILYIEDNLMNLRLMESILERYPGVTLLAAMQAKLGLDLAIAHQPDWILLDVHLPDLSGDDVLRHLKADPRTKDIPVTVVSADATHTQIRRVLQAGAREYITKPLNVMQVMALLESTMNQCVRPLS